LRHGIGAFRKIANANALACIGAHKSTILVKALKVANALDRAVVFAVGLVILDSDPQTYREFSYETHKHHLSSPSPGNLASFTNLDAGGLMYSHHERHGAFKPRAFSLRALQGVCRACRERKCLKGGRLCLELRVDL
jgi:hypothetical protein